MSNVPRDQHSRRNWGVDDSETHILHVDMDSFFAQVEILENPNLRGRPVIVGGSSSRSVVTSATYEARARGVHAGMPTARAIALCPDAHIVSSGRGVYRRYSDRVMEILQNVTPAFEQISIDEAFLDVSGAHRRLGSSTQIGEQIREHIRRATGLPASVGIAQVKSVAKIASAYAKPDGLLLIPAEKTLDFLHGLPVGALWGVGRKSEKILRREGVDTIGTLAHAPVLRLSKLLGHAQAHHLHQLAWGEDARRVEPRETEKSVGTETTFDADIFDREVIERYLLGAAHQCAQRLRTKNMVAWTVAIKVRSASFDTVTRSQTLSVPTDVGRDIAHSAQALFSHLAMPRGGVRLVGVRAESLQHRREGIAVAMDDDGRPRATEQAMDEIVRRFGDAAVTPARLLDSSSS